MTTTNPEHHKGRSLFNRDLSFLYFLCWGGWGGALALAVVIVTDHLHTRPWGTLVVVCIGVAIASGVSLGRRLQTDAIAAVFVTGLRAAISIRATTEARLRTMHSPGPEVHGEQVYASVCQECGKNYPCPTRKILDELGSGLTDKVRKSISG